MNDTVRELALRGLVKAAQYNMYDRSARKSGWGTVGRRPGDKVEKVTRMNGRIVRPGMIYFGDKAHQPRGSVNIRSIQPVSACRSRVDPWTGKRTAGLDDRMTGQVSMAAHKMFGGRLGRTSVRPGAAVPGPTFGDSYKTPDGRIVRTPQQMAQQSAQQTAMARQNTQPAQGQNQGLLGMHRDDAVTYPMGE